MLLDNGLQEQLGSSQCRPEAGQRSRSVLRSLTAAHGPGGIVTEPIASVDVPDEHRTAEMYINGSESRILHTEPICGVCGPLTIVDIGIFIKSLNNHVVIRPLRMSASSIQTRLGGQYCAVPYRWFIRVHGLVPATE